MNRTTTIVLFASIFAIAVGTLGISGNSALLMASAVPQAVEPIGMLGHVEFMVRDSDGNIIKYMQADNIVVNDGEDCVAQYMFGVGGCTINTLGSFTHVGIGNGTSGTVFDTNSTLADALDDLVGTCATASVEGDMARRDAAVNIVTQASGIVGTVLTLDTNNLAFTFDASNATTVYDSGIFNADYGSGTEDKCAGVNTAGTTWDMFARQLLNSNQGITVTPGDSLSVKWTITVG